VSRSTSSIARLIHSSDTRASRNRPTSREPTPVNTSRLASTTENVYRLTKKQQEALDQHNFNHDEAETQAPEINYERARPRNFQSLPGEVTEREHDKNSSNYN